MPTLGPLQPASSGGGVNFNVGGSGGGVFGPVVTSGGSAGTFSAYVAPATYGSGSAASIAATAIQRAGMQESAGWFDDKRLSEIYYLGDKPWSDESRYDDPFINGRPLKNGSNTCKSLLILAAILLVLK